MSFNPAPSAWLGAGYAPTGNTIVLNTNDAVSNKTLAQLTNAEANATTGDVRKLFFALLEMIYQANLAVATADRPAKMRIYRSSSVDETTGVITRSYQVQFDLEATGVEVTAE